MQTLNMNDALDLFNLKAFKSVHPKENYLELSRKFVSYAGGLPLALEVLGGLLYGRNVDEWMSTLERLKDDPEMEILDKLAISFDGLKETEKKIFLDIACFFKGMNQNHLKKILDSSGFHATIGISVLVERSLITIANNIVWMHDLLQEMGQNIVKKESIDEPGKRSRLYDAQDVYHIFAKNTGTEAIEGISCKTFEQKDVNLNPKVFVKMSKLRLLKISNVQISQRLEFLSNELRLLEWHGYPLKQFPSSFKPEKIVELDIRRSNIKQLWNGIIAFKNLRLINLSHCIHLQVTPNFIGIPNLEELILEGCKSLVEVHPSVGHLKGLKILNVRGCTSLQKLACSLEMESICGLNLSGCSKLKNLPDIKRNVEHLQEIFIDGTGIEQLSWPIDCLTGLVKLNLSGCKELVNLPDGICVLKSLKTILLSGCMKLAQLPDNLGNLQFLEILDVTGTGISQLPSSIVLLKNLNTLSCQGCSKLDELPENLGNIESLGVLDLGGTAITQPPTSIVLLKNLKTLSFQGCGGQPTQPWSSFFSRFPFPKKSSNSFCLSLPPLSRLSSLKELNLSYCNMQEGAIPFDIGHLSSLEELDMSGNEFVTIPSTINRLTNLKKLYLASCKKLRRLPLLPASINKVEAEECVELEDFPNPLEQCTSEWSIFTLFNWHRLVRYQDCSILAMNWLKSHFQGICGPRKKFDIRLPGNRIPEWISHQNEGSSISVDVPPNWFSDAFKGFAVCAVLRLHPRPVSMEEYEGPSYPLHYAGQGYITYSFATDREDFFVISKRPTEVITDHLWFLYKPTQSFDSETLFGIQNRITFSCGTCKNAIWDVEIKKCGARLVYAQDIESLLDFDKPANKMASVVKRNRSDDCVESESEEQSRRCSLDDEELQPKRLKWLPFL